MIPYWIYQARAMSVRFLFSLVAISGVVHVNWWATISGIVGVFITDFILWMRHDDENSKREEQK